MPFYRKALLIFTLSVLTTDLAMAAIPTPQTKPLQSQLETSHQGKLLLAKKTRRDRKLRQKHLTGQARNKKGKTSIDFDEASIDGRRRLPAGVAITKNRPDHDYDLINLRLRWHPEMIQSTSNLETGQGK